MSKSSTTAAKKAPAYEETITKGRVMQVPYAKMRNETEEGREPKRQFNGDAGLDLSVSRYMQIAPGTKAQIPTAITIAIPAGYFGLILGRSSTFHNKGLMVHQGIIDSGFRGEVMVVVYNPGPRAVQIMDGDRLAQLILLPVVPAIFEPFETVEDLPEGDRGLAGFGSTGGQSNPRLPSS